MLNKNNYMNRILGYFLIAIFALFVGSQITEGYLLVPYWKTLSTEAFYNYYSQFGLRIGNFYTLLTVVAAVIPIATSFYCFYKKSNAFIYSLIASILILLCIAVFYIYFKNTNQQFFNAQFTPLQLKQELETWEYLHWFRVFLEFLALLFLILTVHVFTKKRAQQ